MLGMLPSYRLHGKKDNYKCLNIHTFKVSKFWSPCPFVLRHLPDLNSSPEYKDRDLVPKISLHFKAWKNSESSPNMLLKLFVSEV